MLDDDDCDRLDYPPALHPGREAATMGCAIVMAAALVVWLGMLAWRALGWLWALTYARLLGS